ncbi:sterol-binding-like protein [Violaceomyces palustris]|uniref:Sterol-binding-like protein n=1 Tax=Violaceomyces palustris TaxID=1673888 RepID=A0ACD0P4G9_9BASI|nr:sterol-binding-like protein [Violaceomyces palustris]
MSSKPNAADPTQRMVKDSQQALETKGLDLAQPGFESSKVFALSASILKDSPAGLPSRRSLVRNLQSIYLFVIHPSNPIDPSNPRTKPVAGKPSTSGRAFKPALWYADLKTKGVIGKGQPPKTVLGRKRKADVVIECKDRDFVDMATGKVHPQKLYNQGRIKIKGDLDRALKMTTLISHERSKIYGTSAPGAATPEQSVSVEWQREGNSGKDDDYGSGSPAPVPTRARL